jgi:hypothetical protein
MTKYIRIDYVVKPDVDLDELKGAIADFVAGIRIRPLLCGLFTLVRSWRRSLRISKSNHSFCASPGI